MASNTCFRRRGSTPALSHATRNSSASILPLTTALVNASFNAGWEYSRGSVAARIRSERNATLSAVGQKYTGSGWVRRRAPVYYNHPASRFIPQPGVSSQISEVCLIQRGLQRVGKHTQGYDRRRLHQLGVRVASTCG